VRIEFTDAARRKVQLVYGPIAEKGDRVLSQYSAAARPQGGETLRFRLLGTRSRAGERLAEAGSTARLVPSLSSRSRGAGLLRSGDSSRRDQSWQAAWPQRGEALAARKNSRTPRTAARQSTNLQD